MHTYYTAVMALCLMSMGVLCVLVWENNRMPAKDKRLLYLTYALIALSTLTEWLGWLTGGLPSIPAWVPQAARCADYILKPMAGAALVAQMRPRDRWLVALLVILAINAVLQVVAAVNGWMVVSDGQGNYSYGVVYPAYLTASLAVVVLVTVESVVYGKGFSRQNKRSLTAVMLFVLAGIAMQALLPARPKAVCVAMAMGASLMYIRSAEFLSLTLDDRLALQREQIDTDILTGVSSRFAYTNALAELDAQDDLPRDLAVFVVDINGLKQVNDTLGHLAGDELIVGAAECLERAFGAAARVFRTGGDEFVVLSHAEVDEAQAALLRVREEADAWHGSLVPELSLSSGHALAAGCDAATAEGLVREADLAMYEAKADYYREAGRDRRRRR